MFHSSYAAPAPLRQGSLLRIVAPSSPFERERFERGLALVEQRYVTRAADDLFSHSGFLAGADSHRLAALLDALNDPDAAAIVAARGGYGATRLLPALDVELVRRARKWLVGFSDVTALHALWARAGLCSIHGPMVASLGEASPSSLSRWFDLLEARPAAALGALTCVRAGRAEGRLFGGNLTVLAALTGTPFMPNLDGTILLLEDIGERPYRLDRMLTSMVQAGVLTGVKGVLLGQFSQCDPGPDGVSAEAVLEERLASLNVPILGNAPIGHVPDNVPVLLGARVLVDAVAGSLSWL